MARYDGRGNANPLITLGIFAATAVAIVVILIAGRPKQTKIALTTPRPTHTPVPPATPAPLTVYVTGAVHQAEQHYTLPPESRVSDAVAAAGGALDTADLSRVNMADILRDGIQIDIPYKEAQANAPLPTPIGGVKVSINSANAEELDALPGIGPVLAQRIVDYRTANGLFASLDALAEVSGIGASLLDELRDLIRFD